MLAALDTYLNDLRRHDRADAATKAEGQFKTALRFDPDSEQYTDQLAALQLENATNDDFLDWRDRLRPGRLPRTVNRVVRAVTAGLNRAHRLGHIGNPAARRLETLPDDDESETAVFLSPAQRKGLIAWPPRQQQPFCVALKFPELVRKNWRKHERPISMGPT